MSVLARPNGRTKYHCPVSYCTGTLLIASRNSSPPPLATYDHDPSLCYSDRRLQLSSLNEYVGCNAFCVPPVYLYQPANFESNGKSVRFILRTQPKCLAAVAGPRHAQPVGRPHHAACRSTRVLLDRPETPVGVRAVEAVVRRAVGADAAAVPAAEVGDEGGRYAGDVLAEADAVHAEHALGEEEQLIVVVVDAVLGGVGQAVEHHHGVEQRRLDGHERRGRGRGAGDGGDGLLALQPLEVARAGAGDDGAAILVIQLRTAHQEERRGTPSPIHTNHIALNSISHRFEIGGNSRSRARFLPP